MSFRNIFHRDEESEYWRSQTEQFPNKIPRFLSKEAAIDFVETHSQQSSNPDYHHLRHSVTTLIDWEQIEKYLLPKIKEYSTKWNPILPNSIHMAENRFLNSQEADNVDSGESKRNPVYEYLTSRMDLSIHKELSAQSTINTLRYLFFHMRCGIFVMIRNNEVAIFCPFLNRHYKNAWGKALKMNSSSGSMEDYYYEKSKHCRKEQYLKDMDEWWANGNIICNEYKGDSEDSNQWWADHFLLQLKDLLAETCNNRVVPDCEFFINKRDYPYLKFNADIAGGVPVEPYGFIFDKDDKDPGQDLPLPRHFYQSYAPILSFYSSQRFADIPIPPAEDWESATGVVFPSSFICELNKETKAVEIPKPRDLFTAENLKKFEKPWGEKVPTAFFRGTATGGGVTPATNQRLHASLISYEWEQMAKADPTAYTVAVPSTEPDAPNVLHAYLDVKITGWNSRDKKIFSEKMTHVKKRDFPFEGGKKNYVEIYKQATYKYLMYIEGHCAACRYGFMMQLGSVILKVESSCVADQMWYFPLLKPYVDHVPVKADMSDLQEKLEWCHSHDEECRVIAENAKTFFHRYICRDGILDYMQAICYEISVRTRRPPSWIDPFQYAVDGLVGRNSDPPKVDNHGEKSFCCKDAVGENALCLSCQALKTVVVVVEPNEAALNAPAAIQASSRPEKNKELKNRMREKAAEKKQKL